MGKTWKELGISRKKGGKKKNKKSGSKLKPVWTPPAPRKRGTVEEFENLGMKVEWVDGKVIIHRNGRVETYNNFDELRVPSRKGIKNLNVQQPKPNAVYTEHNGVKYYLFPNINVAVAMRVTYWPDESEVQPPEHLFGPATPQEFADAIRARIQSGSLNPQAEKIYREYKEKAWKQQTRKAVSRAIRAVAKQNGVQLPPRDVPVSQALIEEMQERGFEVKIKA
ncbi:hypothetical protein Ferp_0504 [Ferroglobus placidus DSM 10642]|uniref:Uncharacterized protein n=1 Tax=Ferroglobus placidus (strain DSM 10642 / AEDII12DO) TaxID=589924 RepID=D3S345_FERPA|nr:hypothetical protein [Ferroglobus placidus]ADC64678.1 hypothetical protein Ferp_0504 [Ferroglobus placidus DSM 10642]